MCRKLLTWIILLIVCVTVCCTNKYNSTLEFADSLLQKGNADSAQLILYSVNSQKFTQKDKAYYYLLTTISKHKLYIHITSDSLINYSVSIFDHIHDQYNLARSYLYKGYVLYDLNRTWESLICWKKAETLSSIVHSPELRIRILSSIAFANINEGNHLQSLKYCKAALSEAEKIHDRRWIGYCLNLIATSFNQKGMMDSCNYYRVKTIPYIDNQPIEERYVYYSNIAKFYWRKCNFEEAESNLRKSLELDPRGATYAALAELLIDQGRYSETEYLWRKAFQNCNKYDSIKTLYPYSKWLWKQNRRQEAWDVAIQIPLLKDSIARRQQAEELQLVQNRYEQQLAEMQQRNKIQQMVICGLCVVLILSLAGFILWRRLQRIRQRLAESQKETEVYILQLRREQEEIAKLEQEQRQLQQMHARSEQEHNDEEAALSRKIKGKEHKVKELQKKIQTLREEQGTMLARGKRKYEDIMNGGNTNGWHKSDYVDFMNYYRLDHFDFFESRDDIWQTMTPREQLFVVLHDMGMTKEEVLFAMGLSKGAYRTISSRISNKGE